MAKHSISQWKKYLPKGARLFLVDDGSDLPFPNADIRNDKAMGIAYCKNQCLTLCEGADYVFLADDDTYPVSKGWYLPYVNSGLNHLCFTFDKHHDGTPTGRGFIKSVNGISYFRSPCGPVLFFTKKCLDVVGGMDIEYGRWGTEHQALSMRIHNAGLTPYPFMDVSNSLELFHSEDYHKTAIRSVPSSERAMLIKKNQQKYAREIKSAHYIPYKQQTGIILTSYFNGVADPQRGEKWESDINKLNPLIESAKVNNSDVIVLNDCFKESQQFKNENVKYRYYSFNDGNPYFNRWKAYREFIKLNKHFENVWMTDCNDVEVLKNPFQIIRPGILYCGWEKDVIGCQWMQNHHKSNFMQNFIKSNLKTPLLNAGVIGGRYDIVMEFLDRLCDMDEILPEKEACMTDMAIFNWVLYSHFLNRFITGPTITTEFKKFEKNNKVALFSHK